MNIDELIIGFNKKDVDVVNAVNSIFRGIKNFLVFLNKKNRLNEIELKSVWYNLDNDDEYLFDDCCLIFFNEYGGDYFLEYFNDVVKESNYYYIKIPDLSFLSEIFSDYDDRTIVGGVLGQDWYRHYDVDESYIDYYTDIYEHLTHENMVIIKEKILLLCEQNEVTASDFHIGVDSNMFDENGVFNIQENIDEVLEDGNLFNNLMNLIVLDPLRDELTNLYSLSYNEAWNEEMSNRVLDSLSDIIDKDTIKWSPSGTEVKIKVVGFNGWLGRFFKCDTSDTILTVFGFLTLIQDLVDNDCLNSPGFEKQSYPSLILIEKNLNDYFSSEVGLTI